MTSPDKSAGLLFAQSSCCQNGNGHDAHSDIDIDLLPGILRDIVELIGLVKTMRLVEERGGTRLYVPRLAVSDDHNMVAWIGRAATIRLQSIYGGVEQFDIPKAAAALRAVRDKAIRRQRLGGCPVSRLARDYALTERQIRSICNRDER